MTDASEMPMNCSTITTKEPKLSSCVDLSIMDAKVLQCVHDGNQRVRQTRRQNRYLTTLASADDSVEPLKIVAYALEQHDSDGVVQHRLAKHEGVQQLVAVKLW